MSGGPLSGRCQGHVSNFYILDLEIVATAGRRCTDVMNVDGQLVDYTTTVKRVVAECTSLLHVGLLCNPLTPLLRFVLDLSYKLYLHCYAAAGKNSTDTSRRAVPLR